MKTLGEALPEEIHRVREEVIPAYESIGRGGTYAIVMMRTEIEAAEKAIREGDIVAQVRLYESLKGWQV